MDRGHITRIIGAAYVAAMLLVLTAPTAYAAPGDASQDGWAHRTTQEVSPDGFAVRSTEQVSPDGFAVRSTQPAPKELTASINNVSPDGFSVRSTGPMPLDGWAVASVELPQETAMVDGWAAGGTTETTPTTGIDGWSYAAVSAPDAPASIARTDAPPPKSSTPPFELYGLAATLAAAAVAGVLYELHRRRAHHLPI